MNGKSNLSSSLPEFSINNLLKEENGNGHRKPKRVFIIGVSGGTASGKTSVCSLIVQNLRKETNTRVQIISQDCFYKPLNPDQRKKVSDYNFDHPDSFDWDLLEKVLTDIGERKHVHIPNYDFVNHSRTVDTTEVYGVDIILFEGILAFYHPGVRNLMDLKIFVDTDADIRLARRIIRDMKHRGRDLSGILHQYLKFVKPSFEEYILPSKKYADIIIPRGADNIVAIDLIVRHIETTLTDMKEFRNKPKDTEHFEFGQFEL